MQKARETASDRHVCHLTHGIFFFFLSVFLLMPKPGVRTKEAWESLRDGPNDATSVVWPMGFFSHLSFYLPYVIFYRFFHKM